MLLVKNMCIFVSARVWEMSPFRACTRALACTDNLFSEEAQRMVQSVWKNAVDSKRQALLKPGGDIVYTIHKDIGKRSEDSATSVWTEGWIANYLCYSSHNGRVVLCRCAHHALLGSTRCNHSKIRFR